MSAVLTDYRVFLYSTEIVLPLVIPMRCELAHIRNRLQCVFGEDIVVSRAEVWEGRRKVMTLYRSDIAALMASAAETGEDASEQTRH